MKDKQTKGAKPKAYTQQEQKDKANINDFSKDKRYTMNFAMSEMVDALEQAERLFPFSKLEKESKHIDKSRINSVTHTNRLKAWQRCIRMFIKQSETLQWHADRLKASNWLDTDLDGITESLEKQGGTISKGK